MFYPRKIKTLLTYLLTYCDEAGDYVVPNVLSPRDLVSRPDNMDETVLSSSQAAFGIGYLTTLSNELKLCFQNQNTTWAKRNFSLIFRVVSIYNIIWMINICKNL